jgi:SAM-dependent methyltransferase
MSKYWKENSLKWEVGAYQDSRLTDKVGWLDRLSSTFRGSSTEARMRNALKCLRPHVNGRRVLDIGCASGVFPVQLIEAGASLVIGYDVSDDAIAYAESNRKPQYPDQLEFRVVDVLSPESELPEVDIVVALGVLEYFTLEEIGELLQRMNTRYFLFHCAQGPTSVSGKMRLLLRHIYLRVKGCPAVYFHSFQEFKDLAESKGYANIRQVGDSCFVTNLPLSS